MQMLEAKQRNVKFYLEKQTNYHKSATRQSNQKQILIAAEYGTSNFQAYMLWITWGKKIWLD